MTAPRDDKPKWTPGPWAADEPENWHGLSARIYHKSDGKFEPVAQTQLSGWPRRVGLANTKLIAAAPDLYAALEECQRYFANQPGNWATGAG